MKNYKFDHKFKRYELAIIHSFISYLVARDNGLCTSEIKRVRNEFFNVTGKNKKLHHFLFYIEKEWNEGKLDLGKLGV